VGEIETVTLTKIKIGMAKIISENMLMDAQSDVVIDLFIRGFRVSLQGYLLGEDIQHEEMRCPRDWREAFKERWFPGWAQLRWPVEYRLTVMDARAIYPEFKPALPNERHFIQISQWSDYD